jgi:hypothetical protein
MSSERALSTSEAVWKMQLARLAAYKAAHGDCNVPQGWVEEEEESALGSWVNTQRVLKRKLDRGESSGGMTAERVTQLTALGFAWDTYERDWEAQLARLAAYKTEHGDLNVPQGWAEDPRLANWVARQRVYKRKLDRGEPSKRMMTAERAAQLTSLGFVWDPVHAGRAPREAEWESQLARLAAFKAEHGHSNVPRGWAEDPQLVTWVHNQRALKRKLDRGESSGGMAAERAARLTAIGFNWDTRGLNWEAQLARLMAYKAEHGDSNVPRGWAEDPQLVTWVDNQRALKRKLDCGEPSTGMTAKRAARLTAIGFAWEPRNHRRGR